MIEKLLCCDVDCIYMLPYVSDVREKIKTISLLGKELQFVVEEYAEDQGTYPPKERDSKPTMYIATLEKAHGIVNSLLEVGRLKEIGK
jgi:POLQ-like helicase